jgi:type I restriction enzyme S subunit
MTLSNHKLSSLCEIKQGRYLSPSQMTSEISGDYNIPVIGGNGILGYSNKASNFTDVSLITCRGSKCGLIQWVKAPVWVSNNAMVCDTGVLEENLFLHYVFSNSNFEDVITGSAQPQITVGHLSSKIFKIPAKETWREKARILNAFDVKINLLQEMNVTLENISGTIFKSWFIDFNFEGAKSVSFVDSEFGKIPENWGVSNIGTIANVIDCLHSKKPDLLSQGEPYLQLNNIKDDGTLDLEKVFCISVEDYKKWTSRIEVSQGDCIITNVGRVGAVAQIPKNFKAAIGRNITAIRLKQQFPFPTFLIKLLLSSIIKSEIKNNTDSGTILDALNVRSIPKLKFILPPALLLEHFENVCRPMRERVESNMNEISQLCKLRDSLLPRLLNNYPIKNEVIA